MRKPRGRLCKIGSIVVVLVLVVVLEHTDAAEKAMTDQRPTHVRHLNERMTLPTPASRAAWEERGAWLREHVRASCGLLPEPERTPLNPQVFGRLERDGYSVEKAVFESRPGFFVCGNLYRPLGHGKGPFPGIACPHGHWKEGRFGHEPPRGSVPGRCITLARLGSVVFSYDMVGYNDSGRQIAHRWRSDREELWGISVMGLQAWNSIRAIDFLQGLPDVDADRIGMTGASGGGTQTFMVMGIDARVKAAAPVNMISCSMQGGCVGENAPLLRIETNSMEIAALMAPRSLLMVSATGDWTKETPKVEFPAIRSIFGLYGATDAVTNVHVDAGHNYNKASREAMYAFFLDNLLGIDRGKPFAEPPFTLEKKEDLLVWHGRDLPKHAKNRESLGQYLIAEAQRQRDALLPKTPADRQRFLDTLGALYRHAVMARLPSTSELETHGKPPRLLLGRKGKGDRVPAVLHSPKTETTTACLVVHPGGNAALPRDHPVVAALLASGRAVLTIDPYLVGDSPDPSVLKAHQKNKNFFAAYNRTPLVERIQDILTALAWLDAQPGTTSVDLVGLDKAAAWCVLAAPFAPVKTRITADLAPLADDDPRWLDDLFSPCILKAGGIQTAKALRQAIADQLDD